MARFLSAEWFEQVNDQLNLMAPPVPGDVDVVIEQHVLDGPEGETTYQVRVAGGRVTVGAPAGKADVVLVVDYATAADLASGRLTAHDAFLGGRIRLRGGVAHPEQAAALAALAVFAPLGDSLARAARSTTY